MFVGKDTAFNTLAGTVTLTVASGAIITNSANGTIQGSATYFGLYEFGSHHTNITGGGVHNNNGYNNSTTNITGGSVYYAGSNDTSTTNISGGTVASAFGFNNGTTNISAGTVSLGYGYGSSTTNISGGALSNGFFLSDPTATLNFVGTGLSSAYQSYSNTNPYSHFSDFFKVSGTIGGVATSYDVYIRNDNGSNGAAPQNTAPRQFTFNGASVVPEVASLTLLALPTIGVLALRIARRRTARAAH